MAEKPSEPVWSIFSSTSEGARLQEYDIFPKLDTPQGGGRTNTTNPAPGIKLESLVIRTDKKPPQLECNKGVSLSPSARGDPSLVEPNDRPGPSATGGFKAKKEDLSLKIRKKAQPSRNEEVHPTPSRELPREFRPRSTVEEPEEAAAAALKYFERKRLESGRKSNFPILDYQSTLKNYYPKFFNDVENGIVGHVPGVQVGLTVRYRDELRLLGIHREKQKGIDSKDVLCKDGWNYERVALSVVLSGVYEDCKDHGELLIYVGEGGRDEKTNQQVKDQTRKRLGNQALQNNCHRKIPVRVIRKEMDASSPSKRLFSYDGLYRVADWEYITGNAGFKVYRFMLVREPNQNALVWQKREPKPFVGHATGQGETKPFVGQVGRAARRKAGGRKGMKPSGGEAACLEATAVAVTSGRSVGEVNARGEIVVKGSKGKQVSPSIKEDFIDVSDEASVSSESEESEENSFIELSDDESVSFEESKENSPSGSEEFSGDMPAEEKSVSIANKADDFIIVDGEEGGDCIVHQELDRGQKVSTGCVEVGEESGKLEAEFPLDVEKVTATGCVEVEGKETDNVEKGNAQDAAAGQATPLEPYRYRLRGRMQELNRSERKAEEEEEKRSDDGSNDTDTSSAENDGSLAAGEYEVEKILDKRTNAKSRRVEYYVRWKGYSEKDDLWLPRSNLNNCRKLVDKFNSLRKRRRLT